MYYDPLLERQVKPLGHHSLITLKHQSYISLSSLNRAAIHFAEPLFRFSTAQYNSSAKFRDKAKPTSEAKLIAQQINNNKLISKQRRINNIQLARRRITFVQAKLPPEGNHNMVNQFQGTLRPLHIVYRSIFLFGSNFEMGQQLVWIKQSSSFFVEAF